MMNQMVRELTKPVGASSRRLGVPGAIHQTWRFSGCTGGAVDFYRIVGGGHTWPGSPLNLDAGLGRKTSVISATEVMTDFFLANAGGGS